MGMDDSAEQLRGIAWLIILALPVLVAVAVLMRGESGK